MKFALKMTLIFAMLAASHPLLAAQNKCGFLFASPEGFWATSMHRARMYIYQVQNSPYYSRAIQKRSSLGEDAGVTPFLASRKSNHQPHSGKLDKINRYIFEELASWPLIIFGRQVQKNYKLSPVDSIYKYGVKKPWESVSEYLAKTPYEPAGAIRHSVKLVLAIAIFISAVVIPAHMVFGKLEQRNYESFVQSDLRFQYIRQALEANKDLIGFSEAEISILAKNVYRSGLELISNYNGDIRTIQGHFLFKNVDAITKLDLNAYANSREDIVRIDAFKSELAQGQIDKLYQIRMSVLLRQQLIFEYLFIRDQFDQRTQNEKLEPLLEDLFGKKNEVFQNVQNKLHREEITAEDALTTLQKFEAAKGQLAILETLGLATTVALSTSSGHEIMTINHVVRDFLDR